MLDEAEDYLGGPQDKGLLIYCNNNLPVNRCLRFKSTLPEEQVFFFVASAFPCSTTATPSTLDQIHRHSGGPTSDSDHGTSNAAPTSTRLRGATHRLFLATTSVKATGCQQRKQSCDILKTLPGGAQVYPYPETRSFFFHCFSSSFPYALLLQQVFAFRFCVCAGISCQT